jgi:hypothetical protein
MYSRLTTTSRTVTLWARRPLDALTIRVPIAAQRRVGRRRERDERKDDLGLEEAHGVDS